MTLTPDNWINLIAAISSFSAAVVALWLGVYANLKNRWDAHKKAGLYASSIAAQLSFTRDVVASCVASCTFDDLTASSIDTSNRKTLKHVTNVLRAATFKPDMETLIGLGTLGNNCANRIASAYDYLNLVRMRANALPSEMFEVGGASPEVVQYTLNDWKEKLMTAMDMLDVALRECVKASELAAPKPSGEELYGPGSLGDD